MQAINSNDRESLRLYGILLAELLDDPVQGQQYIEMSKTGVTLNVQHSTESIKKDILSIAKNGAPTVLAVPVENKGAYITQISNSVVRHFGYEKFDLISKSVSVLLPVILQEQHTKCVEEFLKEKNYSRSQETRKISGIAMGKTGFVFPCNLMVSYMPSLSFDTVLSVRFKVRSYRSYTGIFLTDRMLDILNVSSEVIKIFNFNDRETTILKNSFKLKKEERYNLADFVKELCKEEKNRQDLDYDQAYPKNSKASVLSNKSVDPLKLEEERAEELIAPFLNKSNNCSIVPAEAFRHLRNHQRNVKKTLSNKKFQRALPEESPGLAAPGRTPKCKVAKMAISRLTFKKTQTDFLLVRVNLDLSVHQTFSNLFFKPYTGSFSFNPAKFFIELDKKRRRQKGETSDGENSLANVTDKNLSPDRSKPKKPKKKKLTENLEASSSNEIEESLNFYSSGVATYRLDCKTYTLRILKKPEWLSIKNIEEIVQDTILDEEYDFDEVNEEDNEELKKIGINKSEILSKSPGQTFKASGNRSLRLNSLSLLLMHVVFTVISLVNYKEFFSTNNSNLKTISLIGRSMNYTITTADIITKYILFTKEAFDAKGLRNFNRVYSEMDSKEALLAGIFDTVKKNTEMALELNQEINRILAAETFTRPEATMPEYYFLNMSYIENEQSLVFKTLQTNALEGNLQLLSSLHSISSNRESVKSLFSEDVYFFIYNSMNDYVQLSLRILKNSAKTLTGNSFLSFQIPVLVISAFTYGFIVFFIYRRILDMMNKSNDILFEFLYIPSSESQQIVKKCDNFVKNIKSNIVNDAEEKEEELYMIKESKKNNNNIFRNKAKKASQAKKTVVFATVIILVLLHLYFDVIFILELNYFDDYDKFVINFSDLNNLILSVNLLATTVKVMLLDKPFKIQNTMIMEKCRNLFPELIEAYNIAIFQINIDDSFSAKFVDYLNNELLDIPLKGYSDAIYINMNPNIQNTFDYAMMNFYENCYNIYANVLIDGRFKFQLDSAEDDSKIYNMVNSEDLSMLDIVKTELILPFLTKRFIEIGEDLIYNNSNFEFLMTVWFLSLGLVIIFGYLIIYLPIENGMLEEVILFI